MLRESGVFAGRFNCPDCGNELVYTGHTMLDREGISTHETAQAKVLRDHRKLKHEENK